jgi:hypothetical protein
VSLTSRLAAFCGAVGLALMGAESVLADPSTGGVFPGPSTSLGTVSSMLAANASSARAGASCGLVALFLLPVFFGRLHAVLRAALGPDSFWPTAVLLGAASLLTAVLVDTGMAYAASEAGSYAGDGEIGKVIVVYGWNATYLYAPAADVVVVAGTVAAFAGRALPRWLGWAGGVLVFLSAAALVANGAGGSAIPGLVWMGLASVTLALRPPRAGPTSDAPRPVAAVS